LTAANQPTHPIKGVGSRGLDPYQKEWEVGACVRVMSSVEVLSSSVCAIFKINYLLS